MAGNDKRLEAAGVPDDQDLGDRPGVWRELGELPEGAIVTESGICRIFGRHQSSVKRAIERGELPEPVRMFGQPAWTAGRILRHLEDRLGAAQQQAEKVQRRLLEISP